MIVNSAFVFDQDILINKSYIVSNPETYIIIKNTPIFKILHFTTNKPNPNKSIKRSELVSKT